MQRVAVSHREFNAQARLGAEQRYQRAMLLMAGLRPRQAATIEAVSAEALRLAAATHFSHWKNANRWRSGVAPETEPVHP